MDTSLTRSQVTPTLASYPGHVPARTRNYKSNDHGILCSTWRKMLSTSTNSSVTDPKLRSTGGVHMAAVFLSNLNCHSTFLTTLRICYSLLQHSWLTSVFATAYYKAYGSHISQQPLLPFNIPDYPPYLLQPTTTFLTNLRICYSLLQCIWQPCFSATSTALQHSWLPSVFATAYYNIPDYPPYLLQPNTMHMAAMFLSNLYCSSSPHTSN